MSKADYYFAVQVGFKWSFINTAGEEICEFKYDEVSSFGYGIAPVCINERWGLIDTNGKEILTTKYKVVFMVEPFLVRIWVNNSFYFYLVKCGNKFCFSLFER